MKRVMLISAVMMAFGSLAEARTINLDHVRGTRVQGSKVIPLKKEIKYKNGRINLFNFAIQGVTVKAKARRFNGDAELLVGGQSKDWKTIYATGPGGGPDIVDLYSHGRPIQCGAWKLRLSGRMKLRNVKVHLQRLNPRQIQRKQRLCGGGGGGGHHGRLRFVDLGTKKVDKFIQDHMSFHVNSGQVGSIVLSVEKSSVNIQQVVVYFRNGNAKRLYRLEGHVGAGQVLRAQLNGQRVTSVEIVATSTRAFGSRGKINLKAGMY